jgi:hypothetical protein
VLPARSSSHRERVLSVRRAIDEVPVDSGSDGKRAQNPVDVDLVLDRGLGVGVVRGLAPAEPDLSATLIREDAEVGRRRGRRHVAGRFGRQGDRVARGRVAGGVVHPNGERVRRRRREVPEDDAALAPPIHTRTAHYDFFAVMSFLP